MATDSTQKDPVESPAPPLPLPQTGELTPPEEEGANSLATPPDLASVMAQHTIAAGQVNHGDSRDWAENAVAGVQAALAGFGAAGKVPPGAGALYGVGAAARAGQENRQAQAKEKAQQADRQQQLSIEKQRLGDEESNTNFDQRIKLAENARQQALQAKVFATDDANLKLANSRDQRESDEGMDRHMEFLQKQSDYLAAIQSAGGRPAKVNGAESPEFAHYGELAEWATANHLAVNAHENGYIHRPVILPNGKSQIWEVPDKQADWTKIKDANGNVMSGFADPVSALAAEHSASETRQLNAAAKLTEAEANQKVQELADSKEATENKKILDAAMDKDGHLDTTKLKPDQLVKLRRNALEQWNVATTSWMKSAKALTSLDPESPEYQDMAGNVAQAAEFRDASRDLMRQLDGYKAPHGAGVPGAPAVVDPNTPEGAVAQVQQQQKVEADKANAEAQHQADLDQLESLTTKQGLARPRTGRQANPNYNEALDKVIKAHPNWTEEEKIRAMKQLLGAGGRGGAQTVVVKPGDIITQGGVKYRVKEVGPDGIPTATDAVQ